MRTAAVGTATGTAESADLARDGIVSVASGDRSGATEESEASEESGWSEPSAAS